MNKKIIVFGVAVFVLCVCSQGYATPLEWFKGLLNKDSSVKLSDSKIGAGLKEALNVGIQNAIASLSKNDGYFANQAAKVLLPEGMRKIEPTLRSIGLGPKLDEFTLSMNRAAEKAALQATNIFSSAITDMSFEDAQRIFQGGNTAATEYLKSKTSEKLLAKF